MGTQLAIWRTGEFRTAGWADGAAREVGLHGRQSGLGIERRELRPDRSFLRKCSCKRMFVGRSPSRPYSAEKCTHELPADHSPLEFGGLRSGVRAIPLPGHEIRGARTERSLYSITPWTKSHQSRRPALDGAYIWP